MTPDPIQMLAVIDQNEAALAEFFNSHSVEATVEFLGSVESMEPRELLLMFADNKQASLLAYNALAHTTGVYLQKKLSAQEDK